MYKLLLTHFIDGETKREIQYMLYKAISSSSWSTQLEIREAMLNQGEFYPEPTPEPLCYILL